MRAKLNGRSVLMISIISLIVLLGISAFLFRESNVPNVTATFLSFPDSLRPRMAEFSIANHSSRLVHFYGCQFAIDPTPRYQQAETIAPRKSAKVSITVPEPLGAHTHLEIIFRRQDTPAEEFREMVDSVLKSIGLRVPGLNPDSSANIFKVQASIPKQTN
jgi:hypothetical protein